MESSKIVCLNYKLSNKKYTHHNLGRHQRFLTTYASLSNVSHGVLSNPTLETLNTNLVVWGTNLNSTTKSGRLTKQVRDIIELPSYQKSVVLGLLLSDAWLSLSASLTLKKCTVGV